MPNSPTIGWHLGSPCHCQRDGESKPVCLPAQLSQSGKPSPQPPVRWLRVLVVAGKADDRGQILSSLETLAGIEAIGSAFSVESAVQLASERHPDVMIACGGLIGRLTQGGVVSAETGLPVPIIALLDGTPAEELPALGLAGILVKPYRPADLLNLMMRVITDHSGVTSTARPTIP